MERKMKDSGHSWIGSIPEHWEVCRVKDYSEIFSGEPLPNAFIADEPLYPVYGGGDILGYSKFSNVSKSNLILGRVGGDGQVRYIKQDFWATDNALIIDTKLNKSFVCNSLNCADLISLNTSTSQPLLTATKIKNVTIPLPSLREQEAIAGYLDKKCGEIDELIEIEQQMISDLESYRQAVITEAVTHGLNSDVEMREPGIDWVANFPAHWNIIRFKSIFSTRKGLNITKADLTESGVPVISYGQIHSKQNCGTKVVHDIIKYVPETFLQSDRNALVKQGNFIFADTSEDIAGCGNCAYLDYEGQIFAGYHSIIASRSIKENNKYFAYLFLTDCWRSQIRRKVTGIKVFSVNQAMLSDTLLIVPPLSEQQEIADYLDAKCAEIDDLIKVKQEKIETLKQYRQSLIFEAVTGKTTIA